jgi:hypothetical protein
VIIPGEDIDEFAETAAFATNPHQAECVQCTQVLVKFSMYLLTTYT